MTKIAPSQHPIHDLVQQRWSPRSFAERPIEPEKLLCLLEAARWAPSSSNEQPWAFIVATKEDPAEFERALACLNDNNQRWAKSAPVLMFSLTKKQFTRNERPNRFAFHDLGLAVANLLAQATAFDLYVHQIGGIQVDKVRETYQIPETHDIGAGIAIGYLGDLEQLPDDLQERERAERQRKPLNEFVFSGSWGQPAPWLEAD